MEERYRILSLKNAIRICYKVNNFITAAHLCKYMLEFKGVIYHIFIFYKALTADLATQYEKYYNQLQEKGTNLLKLEFDSTKVALVDEAAGYLCSQNLVPLKNPIDCLKCPYDLSTYEKAFDGNLCPICELSKIGAPPTQIWKINV